MEVIMRGWRYQRARLVDLKISENNKLQLYRLLAILSID
jgi:hypothetical protein